MRHKIIGIFMICLLIVSCFIFGYVETSKADIGDILKILDSPGTSPYGLTWDGSHIWVSDLSDNMIYKCEPENGELIDQFPSPGQGPLGLTWDGTRLWVSDVNNKMIYKLDSENGNILDQFQSPGHCPTGLAWDGDFLWNADSGTERIYQIAPSTGNVVFDFPSPKENPNGLTWDGVFLWLVCGSPIDTIYMIDTDNGNPLRSFKSPDESPTGLTWDGSCLWNADVHANKIYKLDPYCNVLKWFDSPGPWPTGLTWDGKYLWNADQQEGRIYQINPSNGNIIKYFPSPGTMPTGLTYGDGFLWNADSKEDKIYQINPSNGSIIDQFKSPASDPTGLAWHSSGQLLSADIGTGKTYRIDLDDKDYWLTYDYGPPWDTPTGITTSGPACLFKWQANLKNGGIRRVDDILAISTDWESPYGHPWGLTNDGKYLWHTDPEAKKIFKLDIKVRIFDNDYKTIEKQFNFLQRFYHSFPLLGKIIKNLINVLFDNNFINYLINVQDKVRGCNI